MKRRGVIAALVAVAARIGRSQASGAGIVVELQSGPIEDPFTQCVPRQYADGTFTGTLSCTRGQSPEPPFALEVRYGSRVVRLTAKEIMDGLEGK